MGRAPEKRDENVQTLTHTHTHQAPTTTKTPTATTQQRSGEIWHPFASLN